MEHPWRMFWGALSAGPRTMLASVPGCEQEKGVHDPGACWVWPPLCSALGRKVLLGCIQRPFSGVSF